jgi:hypothetical protein
MQLRILNTIKTCHIYGVCCVLGRIYGSKQRVNNKLVGLSYKSPKTRPPYLASLRYFFLTQRRKVRRAIHYKPIPFAFLREIFFL